MCPRISHRISKERRAKEQSRRDARGAKQKENMSNLRKTTTGE